MTIQFNCPQCGASISYAGAEVTIPCPYCNSAVAVPAGTSVVRNWKALNPTVKIILILIIASVVIPTCIGLAGSLLGVVAGVCVPFLSIILAFAASLISGR